MKPLTILALVTVAGHASAFPSAIFDSIQKEPLTRNLRSINGINPGFDPSAQYISTSGQHQWVAPKPTDQRGPCPGLNAFANHGYLPHNGIATIEQFLEATTTVVGMGADLAALLSILGGVIDGNLLSWSIGGTSSLVDFPLLGKPGGLSGSHNKYEGDVSPTRGDLYEYGNNFRVVPSQFNRLYALQATETEATSNYNISIQTSYRVTRFQQSIADNPYFFNNIISGLLVQPATYTFQHRFMANHSMEYPEGRLSQSVLKSWFGVTGDYPNFQIQHGHERIPDNWYRRAFGDEYTLPFFLTDVIAMAVEHPQFLSVGGNLGKSNTFTGIDIANLTGGVYHATTLLDPNMLACFIYELAILELPDLLLSLEGALKYLLPANVTCPKLNGVSRSQIEQAFVAYPGYTKLTSNGTYP